MSPTKTSKPCKDCQAEGRDPKLPVLRAHYPGPRCHNHNRLFVKAQKARTHEARVIKTYGLAPGEYQAILDYQNDLCEICQKPSRVRRLAVDHDHTTGRPRGLLCRNCNRDLLGFFDLETLKRAVLYLEFPPTERMRQL